MTSLGPPRRRASFFLFCCFSLPRAPLRGRDDRRSEEDMINRRLHFVAYRQLEHIGFSHLIDKLEDVKEV